MAGKKLAVCKKRIGELKRPKNANACLTIINVSVLIWNRKLALSMFAKSLFEALMCMCCGCVSCCSSPCPSCSLHMRQPSLTPLCLMSPVSGHQQLTFQSRVWLSFHASPGLNPHNSGDSCGLISNVHVHLYTYSTTVLLVHTHFTTTDRYLPLSNFEDVPGAGGLLGMNIKMA